VVNPFEPAKAALVATPSLVVDVPMVQANLKRLHDYANDHQIQVRPHTKTHKSQFFARMQLNYGASGLTTAKVGEAEVMAQESPDILIAYPVVDPERCRRVAEVAKHGTVRVAVDSGQGIDALAEYARAIGTTVGILVDINVGTNRTGVAGPEDALALAKRVEQQSPALRLDGIFFYPGHIWSPPQEQVKPLQAIDATLASTIELWGTNGLAAPIVSGGSTPTAYQSHWVRSQTEIRPGTYLFNDMNTARAGFCERSQCAAALVCTVVSNAVPGKAVVDAGTKTLTSDRNVMHPESGHGHVIEYPEAKVVRLSEEHGEIDFKDCESIPRIGERLTIIPNHICPCMNLQQAVYLQSPEGLTTASIDTRGMLT